MTDLAPIILFVYNRPLHTKQTLQALERNLLASESEIYIFSDAAKTAQDIEAVNQVRSIIRELWHFKHIHIIERKTNQGLANSIIDGVTKIVNQFGKAIVFEDDLISSQFALQYFNDALAKYNEDEQVMHISGYMYPLENLKSLPETFFFRVPSSWGWATWKRSWEHFNPDIDALTKSFKRKERNQFSIDGKENFWKQVKDFKAGKINSWAIRWYLSMFNAQGLALYPRYSHIQNMGTDGSGTHSDIESTYHVELARSPTIHFAKEIKEHEGAYAAIKFFYAHRKGPWLERLVRYAVKVWRKRITKNG